MSLPSRWLLAPRPGALAWKPTPCEGPLLAVKRMRPCLVPVPGWPRRIAAINGIAPG